MVNAPTDASPLRVGVIGAGGFAEACHVPGLQSHPNAVVVALCGRRAEHARAMADRLGVPEVHTDFRDLCARTDLDAVTITTPNAVHAEQAAAAFAAGKHVFCEKPLGLNVAEVREMLKIAEASGKIHQVAFTFRYTHALQELRRLVRKGLIGEPYLLRIRWDGWGGLRPEWKAGWRETQALSGGGMLFDMGSHLFDAARFVLGPIEHVTGWTHVIPRTAPDRYSGEILQVETDDIAAACFVHRSGVRGEWFMSRATPAHSENGCLEIVGPEGALLATLGRGQVDRLQLSRPTGDGWEALPLPPESATGTPYALGRMMRSFVDACRSGRPDAGVDASFEDGLAAQQALEAVQLSQSGPRWVAL